MPYPISFKFSFFIVYFCTYSGLAGGIIALSNKSRIKQLIKWIKTLSFLRYLNFFDFFVMYENDSIRKVNFKKISLTNNCERHIPNIWRNKSNQKMALAQLIEHNKRNIFLEKSCSKGGGETIPRLFYKKSKLISLSLIFL